MFPLYNVDKRVIYALLIGLAIYSLVTMPGEQIAQLILTAPAVLIAITFHEFAHAKMADHFGDTTPRSQGRLTLNPLVHLDWFGTFLLFFAHIGWGKPVEINSNNFNSNKSRGFCEAMVALAGPLMNFLIAFITGLIYGYIYYFHGTEMVGTYLETVMDFLFILLSINIGLGVFNLIPLPPLDGEKIFKNVIPYRIKEWLDRYYYTLYVVFMILWFTGLLEIVVRPVINFFIFWLLKLVEQIYKLIALLIFKIFG